MSHAPYQTLISASELQALLSSGPAPLLIDLSFDLAATEAGEQAFAAGHLPGAHYLHLDRDLSAAKTGKNGRHPLPERQGFAQKMASLGLRPGRQVVAYDAQGGMYAARLWWMLRWLGHAEVAVLDGGLAAWTEQGGSLSKDVQPAQAARFEATQTLVDSVDADTLQASLGQVLLIDARAPERFRGEVEPLDAQAGHIPGASNRLFKNNLQADGRFKSAALLRAEFDALLGQRQPGQVVHQCGSGVTACHNFLAMQHAGLAGAKLYPGSWSEWSSDPKRPVAKG
ncbi:sulfurtransferase [Paucibacter sp. KBW04]|uniref:sulfurtransferase n=1 Tax=Paucibacter sp. KBW04 TaxID=2153361 RepID=UPI000F57F8D4|nr:sulfurtransferase [Paucibacter sp. KBW04]RQO57428.1 sulfurtransferase [Paucibacter sp. KBW04]